MLKKNISITRQQYGTNRCFGCRRGLSMACKQCVMQYIKIYLENKSTDSWGAKCFHHQWILHMRCFIRLINYTSLSMLDPYVNISTESADYSVIYHTRLVHTARIKTRPKRVRFKSGTATTYITNFLLWIGQDNNFSCITVEFSILGSLLCLCRINWPRGCMLGCIIWQPFISMLQITIG